MPIEQQKDLLEDIDHEFVNRTWIKKILLLEIVTLFVIILIRRVCDVFPKVLYELQGAKFYTFGILVLCILIFNSWRIPKILNRALPKLSILSIDLIALLCLFVITASFKLFDFALNGYGVYELDLFGLLIASFGIAFFCMLIANIRIFNLRGKSILLPVILFIGALLLIGLFADKL